MSAGSLFSLAVTSLGEVYAWGKNDAGQLGQGANISIDPNTMEPFPCLVEVDPKGEDAGGFMGCVTAVAAGANHAVALTADGRVYQWGQSAFLNPSRVEFGPAAPPSAGAGAPAAAAPLRARALAAGDHVSAALDASGALHTWGRNLRTGVLGHSAYGAGTRQPMRVEALRDVPIAAVSLGARHAGAVAAKDGLM